jgi:hypothetical protein
MLWMRHLLPIVFGLAVGLLPGSTNGVAQTSCMLPESFGDPHRVIHDAESLVWVRPLNVDADGAPNAYHRDDPHGRKGLAIEYLGNGMSISRNGEEIPFEPEERDNSEWLEAYRKIVRNGWEAPPGYDVDIYGFARDVAGRVCVTKTGRLISSTSLVLNPQARPCDPKRYLDALKFPGIVVPNRDSDERGIAEGADPEVAPPFAERGVRRGDLAVVYNPETKIWKGALLYDTGPRRLLGEGSIRLVMNLRGTKRVPTSGDETNSMALAESFTVLFPGSVADLGPRQTWTPEKIERAAAERFKQWGGGSVERALERLQSCADDYKQR